MKKQEKIFEVENLVQKLKEAKSLVLTDYRGLSANQANELRSLIKKSGGELQVVKNTLLSRALVKVGFLAKPEELKLSGPTMALFSIKDEIAPVKVLVSFGKNLGVLGPKLGFLGEKFLPAEEIMRYATLPGKDYLQSKLIGVLAQQPQRLIYSLNFNLQKLAFIFKKIEEKIDN